MAHKVSIIIPAFNEEKYLPICLDSISKLDWPKQDLEVIVVDNGSRDQTCRIAESWGAILLKDSTKNVSGLRNLGAGKATGDILAFVDADCVVAEDWLSAASKYFTDYKVSAWGSPPDIPENSTWVQKAWLIVRQKEKDVGNVDWLESMNLFVRKDIFLKTGGFDETLVTCEDVDFSYRVSRFGRIMADRSIKVVHLGEAATVKVFIRKELWRGKGNFQGVLSHGLSLKELPSLAIPVYFGIFLPFFLIFLIFHFTATTVFFALVTLCLPGILALYKVRRKKADPIIKVQLTALMYVYFIVRSLSILPFKK